MLKSKSTTTLSKLIAKPSVKKDEKTLLEG